MNPNCVSDTQADLAVGGWRLAVGGLQDRTSNGYRLISVSEVSKFGSRKVTDYNLFIDNDGNAVISADTSYPESENVGSSYNRFSHTFNDQGRLISGTTASGLSIFSSRTSSEYSYDDIGQLISFDETNGFLENIERKDYRYSNGRLATVTDSDPDTGRQLITTYNYSTDSVLLSKTTVNPDDDRELVSYYTCDQDNRITNYYTDRNGTRSSRSKIEYDESGNKSAVTNYDYDGEVTSTRTYTYEPTNVVLIYQPSDIPGILVSVINPLQCCSKARNTMGFRS